MYAQITQFIAPLGTMPQLRRLIAEDYLPDVSERDGFVSAQLLEQIDDPDHAKLVILWDSQAAVERAQQTNLLRHTVEGLAIDLPGLRIQRDGYIVRVAIGEGIKIPRA